MLPAIGLRLRRWMWSSRHFACSRNVTPWACFTTCRSAPRCPRHFPRRFHGRGVPFQIWTDDQGRRSGIPWLAYAFSFPALPHPSTNERPTIYHLLRYSRPDQFGAGTARVDTFSYIYVTHAGTGEIGIFPGSDYARIGSVKLRNLLLQAASYCWNTGGGPLTRFHFRLTFTSTRLAILMKGMLLFMP